jgi:hypothetical protein
MVMVGHETKTVNEGSISFSGRFKIAYKPFVIFFSSKDVSSFIPARGDMIKGTWIFNPQRPSHNSCIPKSETIVKSVDLTLYSLNEPIRLDEELGTRPGGFSRLKGLPILIINPGATLREKMKILTDAVKQFDLDGIYIRPTLRELLEKAS